MYSCPCSRIRAFKAQENWSMNSCRHNQATIKSQMVVCGRAVFDHHNALERKGISFKSITARKQLAIQDDANRENGSCVTPAPASRKLFRGFYPSSCSGAWKAFLLILCFWKAYQSHQGGRLRQQRLACVQLLLPSQEIAQPPQVLQGPRGRPSEARDRSWLLADCRGPLSQTNQSVRRRVSAPSSSAAQCWLTRRNFTTCKVC